MASPDPFVGKFMGTPARQSRKARRAARRRAIKGGVDDRHIDVRAGALERENPSNGRLRSVRSVSIGAPECATISELFVGKFMGNIRGEDQEMTVIAEMDFQAIRGAAALSEMLGCLGGEAPDGRLATDKVVVQLLVDHEMELRALLKFAVTAFADNA